MSLTDEQREELDALRKTNDAIGGPSFIHKSHWRGMYQPLVQRGLVRWGPHPEMGPSFRATEITKAGRTVLSAE